MTRYIRSQQHQQRTVEYQRFSEDYFSGSDVAIYLGDIWIDEITSLEFAVQESVQPVYGYASYIPDTWARGTRMVVGTFRINFKEAYYIHAVLNTIQARKDNTEISPFPTTRGNSLLPPKTIEALLADTDTLKSKEAFARLASQYQTAIWGDSADRESIDKRMNAQKYDSYFAPKSTNHSIHHDGFNILINYGPSVEETYRQSQQVSSAGSSVGATLRSIVGVQIMSVSQTIDGSGQPIQEEYSFVGKDLDYKIK